MAEAIFDALVAKEGLSDQFHIDSVGTSSYHIGEPAHQGTRQVLAAHGLQSKSRARQIATADLNRADYLIAMDRSNLSDLKYVMRGHSPKGQTGLLLQFADHSPTLDVPDPYYTGNFEHVYRLVEDGCRGLLAHIRQEQGI